MCGSAFGNAYPGQVANVIGIEKKLFKCPRVAQHIIGDGGEAAVALVDVLDLPIAAPKDGYTFEHAAVWVSWRMKGYCNLRCLNNRRVGGRKGESARVGGGGNGEVKAQRGT